MGRSAAESGTRLSGNISCVLSFHSSRFRYFHGTCKHLPGRFCFAWYIELQDPRGITDPAASGKGTRLPENISYVLSFRASIFRPFPDPCGKFTRGVLFRLIHRIIGCHRQNGPDRLRKLERDCLEISVTPCLPAPLGFGIFLPPECIYRGGSVSPDTSNYRLTKGNAPDRQLKLERDCLEITVTSCLPAQVGFGIFLTRVSIYQGRYVAPDTSNYRTTKERRTRSTAETGARLSGNSSYVASL